MALVMHSYKGNKNSDKAFIAAEFAGVKIDMPSGFEMGVTNKTPEFLKMNPLGKIPVLDTPEGPIFESNAIARYVSRLNGDNSLNGSSLIEYAHIEQWIDFSSLEIYGNIFNWFVPRMGFMPYSVPGEEAAISALKRGLEALNTHLASNTYLVGHSVTLADIITVCNLNLGFSTVMTKSFTSAFPHVERYFWTLINQPNFKKVVGDVKQTESVPPIKKAGQPAKPKEQPKKKEAPAAEAPKVVEEEEAPKPKAKNPLDLLPPSPMVLDEWKRLYSNTKSNFREVAIKGFWDMYDPEGYSLWFCDYKYNDENMVSFVTLNKVGGFLQRMDLARKYAFGKMLICGSEGPFKVKGLWLFRGPEIPKFVMDEFLRKRVRLSAMAKVFEAADASNLMTELRMSFDAGVTRGYEWRVSQLKKLLVICDNHEPEIVSALHDDLGKPELESSVYEVALLRNSIKLALKQLKNWMAPDKAKTSLTTFPASAEIVSEPLGVVLVISAWNYPFLLSIDPVIGAISAGNAVVLKPSELAPASSSLLAKLLEQYLDPSAVRVIEGAVTETTLLLEQKWDKIFYTGSSKIGRIIMMAAAKHLIPVVLELGGKSPVVIDSDTNLKITVKRIIAGKWGCNNGQACISPDYILTTKEYAPKVIDAMKQELEAFYGKNPMESKDMSRIVNSNHFDRLSKILEEKEVSDKIVYGGQKNRDNLKIAPTILLDVPLDSLIMSEEIFGPLLPILTLNNLEECFDVIRSRPKPLAAYLFTQNQKLKERFAMTVSAGGIVVNDIAVHLSLPTLPFGGVGESGMGSYHGKFSFDAFSHKKAVLYKSFIGDAAIRYPPYSRGKLRLLKALVNSNLVEVFKVLLGLS